MVPFLATTGSVNSTSTSATCPPGRTCLQESLRLFVPVRLICAPESARSLTYVQAYRSPRPDWPCALDRRRSGARDRFLLRSAGLRNRAADRTIGGISERRRRSPSDRFEERGCSGPREGLRSAVCARQFRDSISG